MKLPITKENNMKYEMTMKIEDGKVSSKWSGNMEIFGLTVKVKEYELSGDLNKMMESLIFFIEGREQDQMFQMASGLCKMFGIKTSLAEKLVDAIVKKEEK